MINNESEILLITGAVASADSKNTEKYEQLVSICQEVYSGPILSPLDTMKFQGTDLEKYIRGMRTVESSKIIIAEVSAPSHGQGLELKEAEIRKIPILIIHERDKKVSGMIKGLAEYNGIKIIEYENIEEIKESITSFIEESISMFKK